MLKYGNKKTVVDGITFASKAEARRYGELKILERCKHIADLRLQPRFDCIVNGTKVCTYIADFQYFDLKAGANVVEDVKGFKNMFYRLKKKLVHACLGIEIKEV